MQLSDIKSRPLYAKLRLQPKARHHLLACEGEGALAVEEAFAEAGEALARTTIVYRPGASASKHHQHRLAALSPEALHVLPSGETAMIRLAALLAKATMGTHLYLAGTEDFIGEARRVAAESGLTEDAVQCEHRGALSRRVQCVHCKGFTAEVVASPVPCSHCGLALLVRDHYSRRLGAFMGVCIDAEAPGEIPAAEAFPA